MQGRLQEIKLVQGSGFRVQTCSNPQDKDIDRAWHLHIVFAGGSNVQEKLRQVGSWNVGPIKISSHTSQPEARSPRKLVAGLAMSYPRSGILGPQDVLNPQECYTVL